MMINNTASIEEKKQKNSKIKQVFLFIFCAIPGLFIILVSSFALIFFVFESGTKSPLYLLSIPGMVFGFFLILIGTQKIDEWMHGIVFLSVPFLMTLLGIIWNFLKLPSITVFLLFLTISMFSIEYAIKRYYKKKKERGFINNDFQEKT